MAQTYNYYGSHSSLHLIPDFLLIDAPDFGAALGESTVVFHFRTSGPPRRSLEESYASFISSLVKLPKVVFRRSRQQASIAVRSELMDGSEWDLKRAPSLSLFEAGINETLEALNLLKMRLTTKDDFRLDLFLNHCQSRKTSIPSTDESFAQLREVLGKRRATSLELMSPWERLGIDFRDFHSNARRILDDPFFWGQSNDFAPHGNDTGADLLADYSNWLKRHPNIDSVGFYNLLVKQWGVPFIAASERDQMMLDEAAVALAFAEMKLRGTCHTSAVDLAKAAVERQREQALSAVNWVHRGDRLKSLEAIELKLLNVV